MLFKIKLGFFKPDFPYNISLPSKSVIVPPECSTIAWPAAISHSYALGSATYPSYSPEAKEILDVEDVVASILLLEDLRIQKN